MTNRLLVLAIAFVAIASTVTVASCTENDLILAEDRTNAFQDKCRVTFLSYFYNAPSATDDDNKNIVHTIGQCTISFEVTCKDITGSLVPVTVETDLQLPRIEPGCRTSKLWLRIVLETTLFVNTTGIYPPYFVVYAGLDGSRDIAKGGRACPRHDCPGDTAEFYLDWVQFGGSPMRAAEDIRYALEIFATSGLFDVSELVLRASARKTSFSAMLTVRVE